MGKIVFRRNACFRPLGCCIIFGGLVSAHESPTISSALLDLPNPSENGKGNAVVYLINDNTLVIFPNQHTYLNDFTVPITNDIDLPSDITNSLEKSSITISKGKYRIHSNFQIEELGSNGYVLVNYITE